MIDMFFSDLG